MPSSCFGASAAPVHSQHPLQGGLAAGEALQFRFGAARAGFVVVEHLARLIAVEDDGADVAAARNGGRVAEVSGDKLHAFHDGLAGLALRFGRSRLRQKFGSEQRTAPGPEILGRKGADHLAQVGVQVRGADTGPLAFVHALEKPGAGQLQ